MTALALDPGMRSGWARSDGTCGVLDVSKYADHGQALAVFHDWLDCELRDRRPVYLAIERAVFTGRMAHADLTLAMIRVAHMVAWSHDVPRHEKSANDVRKWLIGRARRRPGERERDLDRDILNAVRARGMHAWNEHAVDAAALLCMCEGRQVVSLAA